MVMRVAVIHRLLAFGHGLALNLSKYGDFDGVAEVSDHGDIFNTLINGDPDPILADSDFPALRLEDSILQIK